MDPVITLLRDLVAIDSVNPSLVPGAAGEVADRRGDRGAPARGSGSTSSCRRWRPGVANVIGVLEGRRKGRSLMFCGHIDTVGVEGMTAPFDPVERDGRLYGRGAQDMKGGVAAMIDAARLVARKGWTSGRLIVAAVVDEEYASVGADALVTRWRADAAVVTEPTDLQIAIGHKGFAWFEVETRGRAAHGSRPEEGRDAILRMGRVLGALEELDRRLASRARTSADGRRVAARQHHRRRTRVEQLSRSLHAEAGAAHDPAARPTRRSPRRSRRCSRDCARRIRSSRRR